MNFTNLLAFRVETLLMVVILAFLVVLMVFGYLKRRKFGTQLQSMRDNIKKGDRVMTDTGVVGEILDITVEGEHKYFTIKTGSGKNVGYMQIHSNAVYYVFDDKTPNYTGVKEEESFEEAPVEEATDKESK